MGEAREVIERFYDAFDRKDPAWKELVAPDIRFVGPLQSANGAGEFAQITEMFLQFHKATRLVARFEDGSSVCSFLEFDLTTPAGAEMRCTVSELATIADGKLSEVRVIYDPRDFATALGLS